MKPQKKDVQSSRRLSLGEVGGFVSFSLNLLLFCLKTWLVLLTGSVALAADAKNSLSDLIGGALLFCCARARRRGDGAWRGGTLGTYSVCLWMVSAGIPALFEGAAALVFGAEGSGGDLFFYMLFFAAAKLGLGLFLRRAAKRAEDAALRFAAKDSFFDAASALSIGAASLCGEAFFGVADAVLGCLFALGLIRCGVSGLRPAANELLKSNKEESARDATGTFTDSDAKF